MPPCASFARRDSDPLYFALKVAQFSGLIIRVILCPRPSSDIAFIISTNRDFENLNSTNSQQAINRRVM